MQNDAILNGLYFFFQSLHFYKQTKKKYFIEEQGTVLYYTTVYNIHGVIVLHITLQYILQLYMPE